MADTLELPARSVDLSTVKGMSDEDYAGLLVYARQWDDPNEKDWVAQIEKARGEKSDKK